MRSEFKPGDLVHHRAICWKRFVVVKAIEPKSASTYPYEKEKFYRYQLDPPQTDGLPLYVPGISLVSATEWKSADPISTPAPEPVAAEGSETT